jgi:hypothetical protein
MNRITKTLSARPWRWAVMLTAAAAFCLGADKSGCVEAPVTVQPGAAKVEMPVDADVSLLSAQLSLALSAQVGQLQGDVSLLKSQNSQAQHGIINIASNGETIGGYAMSAGLAFACWRLWAARAYWKKQTTMLIEKIERGDNSHIKEQAAKITANTTPFGKHVQFVTDRMRRTPNGK